jgi:hypothetical protein
MYVVGFEQADEDDGGFVDIAAWHDLPALADDVNLGTRSITSRAMLFARKRRSKRSSERKATLRRSAGR